MALRNMGASPNGIQNPGSSDYVAPASSPTTNAINPSQIARAGQQQQSQQPTPQPGQAPQPQIAPQTTFNGEDPNLSIALGALANFAKAHAESHMADHGVHMAKANAKVREAQAPAPQTAPVS
jgi:hypothetical protein